MVKENVTANFPASKVADEELGVLTNIEGETLTGDVTSTQSTFDVSDASVYEAGMYVAVWTGGTLSIYRVNSVDAAADQITLDTDGTGNRKAFDGTTANSHNEADEVACYAVAKTFNQSRAEVVAMQDWLGTDGDTVTWDRALELHYTGTAGTPTLRVGTVSGQGDPEPLIEFERSTDGGSTWSSVGAIDYDPPNDQLELSNIAFVAAASSNIILEDGQELRFGTDEDTKVRWDETNTRTEAATDNPVRLQRQATVTDASALDSPTVEWEGQYDSDATGSSLTASTRVIGAQNVVEYASAGGDYRLAFTDDAGAEFVTLEGDTQNVGIQATDPTTILALVENDTGLAHPSVDTIGLQTGGIEALRVQSDQDIALQAGTTLWLSSNNDAGLLRRAADEVGIAQSDDVSVLGPDATSTTTTQNSPDIILTGQHWNGTATVEDDAVVRHAVTATTPASQIEVDILGTTVAVLTDAGKLSLDGGLDVGVTASGTFDINGTTVFENDRDVAIDLLPNADNTLDLGSASRRWRDIYSAGGSFQVIGTSGDSNPETKVTSQQIEFGAGGASATDVILSRSAADTLQLASGDTFSVETVSIQNQGAGSDPTLTSNNASQVLALTGALDLSGNIELVNAAKLRWDDAGGTTHNVLQLFSDDNVYLDSPVAGSDLIFRTGGTEGLRITGSQDINLPNGSFSIAGTVLFEADRDFAVDLIPNAANTLSLGSATREYANLFLGDDAAVQFGSAQDWLWQYDSANTQIELTDGTNVLIAIDDGTTVVDVPQGDILLAGDAGLTRRAADELGAAQADAFSLLGADATSTTTTQNSSDLILTGQHWTGAATSQDDAVIRHNITATTPTSQLDLLLLGTNTHSFLSGGALDMVQSGPIQDAGTDAIQFDGSQNVTMPNGDLSVTADISMVSQALTASQRVTSNTTLTNSDHLVVADASGGSVTITLPASPDDGRELYIKVIDPGVNSVTIARNGNNIDEDAANATLTDDNEVVHLKFFSGQSSWYVMGRFAGGGVI